MPDGQVTVSQYTDGVLTDSGTVVPPAFPDETPAEILARKAEAHAAADGWTVEWDGPNAFHAWKEYGPEVIAKNRKDRYFRLTEA